MQISFKQLKKVLVETESGTALGHVVDLVLDTQAQAVQLYEVKSAPIAGKQFMIKPSQVVRFEVEKLIVDDTFTAEAEQERPLSPPMTPEVGGVAMRQP